jgi:hypothetical protein
MVGRGARSNDDIDLDGRGSRGRDFSERLLVKQRLKIDYLSRLARWCR